MLLALQATVVVGQAVQAEVVDEAVQADRDPGGPAEVLFLYRRVELEHGAGQVHPLVHLIVGDGGGPDPEIVEFEHLHVAAEVRADQGEVGGHVEHAGIEVPHQPVPTGPERAPDTRRGDPAADPGPGALVLEVAGHRAERHPNPGKAAGHLRQRARAAVGQPFTGPERGVVHLLGRLKVDQQHRGAAALRDRHQHGRGHVGGEEPHDEVAAGRAQHLGGPGPLLGVGDEPGVDDVAAQPLDPLADPLGRGLQLRQQVRELRPVGAEAAGHQAHRGGTRGDARQQVTAQLLDPAEAPRRE